MNVLADSMSFHRAEDPTAKTRVNVAIMAQVKRELEKIYADPAFQHWLWQKRGGDRCPWCRKPLFFDVRPVAKGSKVDPKFCNSKCKSGWHDSLTQDQRDAYWSLFTLDPEVNPSTEHAESAAILKRLNMRRAKRVTVCLPRA